MSNKQSNKQSFTKEEIRILDSEVLDDATDKANHEALQTEHVISVAMEADPSKILEMELNSGLWEYCDENGAMTDVPTDGIWTVVK
jgi:hypothetical protein